MNETNVIDWDGFAAQTAQAKPFPHVIMPAFVRPAALPDILRDFPKIKGGGSYPLDHVQGGPGFKALIEDLKSETMREHCARLFAIDLADRPITLTVRGHTRDKDGQIHADSKDKLITVLLYLNEGDWQSQGGRLRLLHSADDMDDYAVEAPPTGGTLVAFLNGPTAYHGHKPFSGPRQSIQLNWVTDRRAVAKSRWRHKLSAWLKGRWGS
ncbi:MAG: 2OG-Fe(II) oxygenase [Pseudomonadota bacterium]